MKVTINVGDFSQEKSNGLGDIVMPKDSIEVGDSSQSDSNGLADVGMVGDFSQSNSNGLGDVPMPTDCTQYIDPNVAKSICRPTYCGGVVGYW